MFNSELQYIYRNLERNQGYQSNPILHKLSVTNLSMLNLCDKYFDQELLKLILQLEDQDQLKITAIDDIVLLLQIFQGHLLNRNMNQIPTEYVTLMNDQMRGQMFLKNMAIIVTLTTNEIALQFSNALSVSSSQSSMHQLIEPPQLPKQLQKFQEILNWYIQTFIKSEMRMLNSQHMESQKSYFAIIDQLPQCVASSMNHKLISKEIIDKFVASLHTIVDGDGFVFNEAENAKNQGIDIIYSKLKHARIMIGMLNSLLTQKALVQIQSTQSFEMLHQYGFLYFQKSLKYFDMGAAPQHYAFLVRLLKISKDDQGWQLDIFQKSKMQKYLKDMFEVLARNIQKASISQIYEFAESIQCIRNTGFDILYQINFFQLISEIHYKFLSFLIKVQLQLQQLSAMKTNNQMIQDQFLLESKITYVIKSLEMLFVQCFYQDEHGIKTNNDKRVHQIIQLWNLYFEVKSDPMIEQQTEIAFTFHKGEQGATNKTEEQQIKRLSFLQMANRFLIRDKTQEISFSGTVIADLISPKLDLSQVLQQLLILQTKVEKPSVLTTQLLIKRMYKFYLNLMGNSKDAAFRDKILIEISRGITQLFTSELLGDDIIKQSMLKINLQGTLLDYVALKMSKNYKQCDFEEQVKFLNETLKSVITQFSKIEEEFLVSVETCKGTVEGMRHLSLFRQLVQKAQGQKYQNLSLGSIVEKKVIDLKKVFQLIPLLAKCSETFLEMEFQNLNNSSLKQKTASLILEFWIYITLNNPYFMVHTKLNKENKHTERLTYDEAKDLSVVIQPLKDIYVQMQPYLNQISYITPSLLPGHKVSFMDSKILVMLTENRATYTCQNFYLNCYNKQMKILFKIKKKTFVNKLEISELLFIVVLNEIMQRSLEEVNKDLKKLQQSQTSFIDRFIGFIRSQGQDDEDEIQHKEITSISVTHQNLQNTINSRVKFNSFIKESITRAAVKYTTFLLAQKGTLTKDIISRDFVFLIQLSCSIEKTLKEYAQDLVVDYIKYFPFLCFAPEVIKVFSELITFIHMKVGKEFDSKSTYLQNEQIKYRIMLHTDQKMLTQNLIFIMNCLLKLIFRGYYIDHIFIKMLTLHFIKQETSLMSQLPFGYRFLKFIISSFKIDKEAIEAFKNQADKYNPYFWMVKEVEFDSKFAQSDLTQFVIDKGLIRLQKINIDQLIPSNVAHEILKQIDESIKNEIEFDFHLDEKQYNTTNQTQSIMKQIIQCCQEINICQYFSINKTSTNLKLIKKLTHLRVQVSDQVIKLATDQSNFKQIKTQIIKDMILQVTSLKSVMFNKGSQVKGAIITQLLDICKHFLQPQLLKFILLRLIPYLHSTSPNYFDSTFFFLLGEMLHYTMYQVSTLGSLKYDKKISSSDIFQIRSNYFNQLPELEIDEFTLDNFGNLNYPVLNFVNMAQIGYYEMRWKCLCKIHYILIRFFNDNMQIHLVKNVKLSVIANIIKINFQTDKKLVEHLPLVNVCQVLKGSIEIIQLMKDLKEKFKPIQLQEIKAGERQSLHPYCIQSNQEVKFDVESFYYKTLKFGLSHYAKNINMYSEPLFSQCGNQQKLMKRHQLYKVVCKYLSKDKLHELNEESKITRLKRVKKRFNSVLFKKHRQEKLQIDGQDKGFKTSVMIDGWAPSMARKIQADIGYNNQQVYSLSLHVTKSMDGQEVRPYYLRKALFFLLCNELDKIKAFAHKLQVELETEYSLQNQNKLNENFIQQILNEIPDKNLNLAYQIITNLYPLMSTQYNSVHQVLYKFLGAKITQNHHQYLDCPHFFDILVTHNVANISTQVLKNLIYWKPPHIQLILKYITDQFEDSPEISLLFSKIMKRVHSEQIIFYLPQLIQSLASRSGTLILKFLVEFAQQSVLFAHQVIWLAKVECKIDSDHKRPPSPKGHPDNFKVLKSPEYQQQLQEMMQKNHVSQQQLTIFRVTPVVIAKIIRNMDQEQTQFFKKLDGFFERVTAISGVLRPQMAKTEKRDIIAQELLKIEVSPDIYMPTNPRYQLTGIKLDSGAPMQSAAKCPILVSFYCRKFEGPDKHFEKKLKLKKELMKQMEQTVKAMQYQQFENDPMPDDEDKGPLFINELVRPIQQSRCSMHSSIQSSIKQPEQLQRRISAEEMVQRISVTRKKLTEQTSLRLDQQNQSQIELKSCIFKVFDDIRQDNLALQIIQMFKGIFDKLGLDLFAFPYKAISNRTGHLLNVGGIIEVIPNTISRDQMGKTNRCSLYEYFIHKFGAEDSPSFQVARENFIKSQAAYSIISYILQIKDRHNGNILISEKGHLIHIDFGFIFDISPGGNMKFESANFKLTKEMIQIMGGSPDSEAFKYYMDLTVRGFLAIRKYYDHMYYLVKLMLNSGLGCFQKDSLKNFTDRFQLKKNDLAASKYIKTIITDAFDKMTTRLYDDIQFYQNGISR